MLTQDAGEQAMIRSFWDNKNGTFSYAISTILNFYHLPDHTLLYEVIKEKSIAYFHTCTICGNPVQINGRFMFEKALGSSSDANHYCAICSAASVSTLQYEQQTVETAFNMQKANVDAVAERGQSVSLSAPAQQYLKQLVKEITPKEANPKHPLLSELLRKRVVAYHPGRQEVYIPYETHVEFSFCRPNTIFNKRVYRNLSHILHTAYIYPNIRLAMFVDQESVAHLFTAAWHANYFAAAFVDFLACTPEGLPMKAVMIAPKYEPDHYRTEPQRLFTCRLLGEVGLEIFSYSYDLH